MHPEFSGLVRSGADDAALARPADDHRLTTKLRPIALFDRRVECVHVDMDDFPHLRCGMLNVQSLLSGQKSKSCSWLRQLVSFCSCDSNVRASARSSFSKRVTDRICRRVCSEALRLRRFLMMATST